MSKEIEAQILYINYDNVISQIKKMGAELKFDWIKFRISAFNPCLTQEEQKEKYGLIFTRVRDEGRGIITITTKVKPKSTDNSDKKFAKEYEIKSKNTFEEYKIN